MRARAIAESLIVAMATCTSPAQSMSAPPTEVGEIGRLCLPVLFPDPSDLADSASDLSTTAHPGAALCCDARGPGLGPVYRYGQQTPGRRRSQKEAAGAGIEGTGSAGAGVQRTIPPLRLRLPAVLLPPGRGTITVPVPATTISTGTTGTTITQTAGNTTTSPTTTSPLGTTIRIVDIITRIMGTTTAPTRNVASETSGRSRTHR